MKNAWVVVLGLSVVAGCGAAPAESAWLVKTHNVWCDKIHSTLSETQKGIPLGIYIGTSAGDCKAAFNEEIADGLTRVTFGDRKFVQAEADKCTEAIAKLDQQAVYNLIGANVDTAGFGDASNTAHKDQLQKLSLADTFSCYENNNCRSDAGCSLSANAGPCAGFKIAPLKDGNLATQESNAFSAMGSSQGCGVMQGF